MLPTSYDPQTRSGKIMRRVLRKIASGEEDSIGDVSTLADPSVSSTLTLCPAQSPSKFQLLFMNLIWHNVTFSSNRSFLD